MWLVQSDMPFSLCSVSWGTAPSLFHLSLSICPSSQPKQPFPFGFQEFYSICLDNRDCNFHLLSKYISLFFSLLALLLPLEHLLPERMFLACFTDVYTQHNWTWQVRNSQCSLRMQKVSTSWENALGLFHQLLYPAQLNVACERQPMLRWMGKTSTPWENALYTQHNWMWHIRDSQCSGEMEVPCVSKMFCLASYFPSPFLNLKFFTFELK